MAIDMMSLFERRMSYPHPEARDRLARLVGLDDHIARLTKVLALLVHPGGLIRWGEQHHPHAKLLINSVLSRSPLVILAGDIGSGKTELAETIADAVGRQEEIEIELLPLSLSARGHGKVGEMTQLISAAFDFTIKEAAGIEKNREGAKGAVILLVDEADALAHSRESVDLHHEEISGVNAFIRGIDRLSSSRLPAAVIMCTNRYDALDPAVTRRAAEILVFGRPDADKRRDAARAQARRAGLRQGRDRRDRRRHRRARRPAWIHLFGPRAAADPGNRSRRLPRQADRCRPGAENRAGNEGDPEVRRPQERPAATHHAAGPDAKARPARQVVTEC